MTGTDTPTLSYALDSVLARSLKAEADAAVLIGVESTRSLFLGEGGRARVIAAITERAVIVKILTDLRAAGLAAKASIAFLDVASGSIRRLNTRAVIPAKLRDCVLLSPR